MDLLKLMESRYSVRKFSDRTVEDEKINLILRAGQLAPTACNNQPQKILVLKNRESLELWKKCTSCHFNEQLVMIVCCDKDISWKRSFDGKDSGFVDASIVTTQMMLEAADIGIGSTWIMYFNPKTVRTEFKLPENYEPVAVLAMGYASDDAKPAPQHSSRKNLSETVAYDSF